MPKAIEKIIKSYSVQVKAVEGQNRTLRFVASCETCDRDGEVVSADGWVFENFMKNPVFMWAHQYDQPPIGKVVAISVADGNVIEDVEFADAETYPFADIVYRLYQGGFLNAVSVGFIPIEWETGGKKEGDPRKRYTKQEMLETSAVPVPSNPDALQQARSAKVISLKEMRLVKKSFEAVETKTLAEDIRDAPIIDKTEPLTQDALADELDYVLCSIREVGLNEKNTPIAKELMETLKRLTGSDIPVQDKSMPKKTTEAIKTACKEVQNCLDGMKAHHKAHNEFHKTNTEALTGCLESLSAMCGEEPEPEKSVESESETSKALKNLIKAVESKLGEK